MAVVPQVNGGVAGPGFEPEWPPGPLPCGRQYPHGGRPAVSTAPTGVAAKPPPSRRRGRAGGRPSQGRTSVTEAGGNAYRGRPDRGRSVPPSGRGRRLRVQVLADVRVDLQRRA